MKRTFLIFCIAALLCMTSIMFPVLAVAEAVNNTTTHASAVNLLNLQVPFVENQGQQPYSVKFYADTFYGTAYITDQDLVHAVALKKDNETKFVALKEQFTDMDDKVITFAPKGTEPAETKVSYFTGNDSSKWKTNLPTYNLISLGEIYPGISVSVKAHSENVEKLFTVEPGANPENIQIKILGADSLKILENGSISILTEEGEIIMAAPKAFQTGQDVMVAYRVLDNSTYSFTLGKYDRSQPLLIDPSLAYSSFLGGSAEDQGWGIAVDSSGGTYITGYTTSTGFPTTSGVYNSSNSGSKDIFVSKINSVGGGISDLVYSTYLGGSLNDQGRSIEVDSSGNAYIIGYTLSSDFPTTEGAYNKTLGGTQDALVIKLNPSGTSLLYSTYLGGSSSEYGIGITFDSLGNVYIAGYTGSTDFPTTSGAYQTTKNGSTDGFVSKINPNGNGINDLVYSTYIGGGSGNNYITSIKLDDKDMVYTGGYTSSASFPTTSGAYQTTRKGSVACVVSKINIVGGGTSDLVYSTYLGGTSSTNSILGLALDSSGNIYVTGSTSSTDFPTTAGAYQKAYAGGGIDTFVSKIFPAGNGTSDLAYSTYLGGSSSDGAYRILLDGSGNIYLTGYTSSSNFPTTTDAYQTARSGGNDAFITKIYPVGSGTKDLVYSTYLGGTGTDYGIGIAADNSSDVYITGYTAGAGFPTTSSAYQTTYGGGTYDTFIAKLTGIPDATSQTLTTINVTPATASMMAGLTQQFNASAKDQSGSIMYGVNFTWSSDNETVGTVNETGFFTSTGAGAANVTVSSGNVSGTAQVTVLPSTTDIVAVSIATGSPIARQAEIVNITVKNIGTAASGVFNVTLLANSTEVGRVAVSSLGWMESTNVSIPWTPKSEGSVNLTTIVDPDNAVADSNTTNNMLSKTVTVLAPDLVALSIAGSPVVGQAGTINVTVKNTGTAAAGAFNITLLADNTEVNRISVTSLTVSESLDVSILWTPSIAGKVNLTAVMDPENTVADSNTTNNVISYVVTVINSGSLPDLIVNSLSTLYPYYNNTITATIQNQGTQDAGPFKTNFTFDGITTSFDVPNLAAGNTTTLSVSDPVSRKYGDIVPIAIMLDTENAIAETDENNNVYNTTATVSTNGNYYTGGRYYSGNDLETGVFVEGNVAAIYSLGDSGYQSGGTWYSTTVHWKGADLPIPANATIKDARIYQSYTWCANGNPDFTVQFNGNTIDQEAFYADPVKDGDGAISGFNGQAIYNVTQYFNASGNKALIAASKPNGGLYGVVLVVVYEDASEPYRMIWLDEGCDTLYGSSDDYHIAYSMFNNVTTENLVSAKVTTILPSGGDSYLGTIICNGQISPIIGSGGGDPGYKWYNVTGTLQSGTNEVGVRNDGGYLNLALAILEVTKETASEANFTGNTTNGDAPLAAKFTDTSTGTPTSWTWNFGDGGASTEQNPTHTYTTEGTYNVTLTVSNSLGSDSEEKIGYITVGSVVLAPVANFSSNVTSGEAPLSVQFNDESTNTPTSWAWDFGDSSTSTEQNPSHTYETAGTYTVKLTATNYGGSNTTEKADFITVTSTESAPSANFTVDANSGQVPFTVHFIDTSTGSISSWNWDFGDGSTSSEQNPIHTYVTEGNYNVSLTAKGPGGSSTATLPVTVSAPLTANSYNGGIPLTTVQNGTVSGGIWYDSYPGFNTSAQKTFTLPAHTDIKWARLYVDVYDGHMQNNYKGNVNIGIDANGDSTYEIQKNETFNTGYSFPGEGGTGPVWVNDHMNRVTSDYLMWYDLADAISGQTVNVQAISTKIDSSFDGRVKAMTLVVAYDDGDSDQVKYWVNQGHDTVNPLDTEYSGLTSFGTSSLASGWSSANLTAIYFASVNGKYTYHGTELTSGVKTGPYYGSDTWDVSSLLTTGQDSALAYNKQGENDYYKIPLALMSVRYIGTSPILPEAVFTADITSGTAPLTVNFTDQSTGSPSSWFWDFGDGFNATEQNISHTYISAGNYTVNLTVSNSNGNDSEVKTEYIVVSKPLPGVPVANFIATPTFGDAPLTVNFTDQSTGEGITAWLWDFDNDGTVDSTEQNPSHTYANEGNYTVNLTVSNAGGSDTKVKTEYIVVSKPLPGAPVANFTAASTSGNVPLAVQFTDASTGSITSYAWDFNNDGNVDSTEQSPSYTYSATGTYTVNLTVTGPGGSDFEVKTGYINVSSPVSAKPVAAFSASPTLGIMPLNVQFTDQSTGVPTSWSWNFGDGSNSTDPNPSHTYSKVGKFTVSLTVKNKLGSNTTKKTGYIDVEIVPVADFSANKTLGKSPLAVKFTDKSTGTPTSWLWDFGDGSNSTEKTPVHVYSAVGRYNVTLTAANAVGNNTITKSDYIDVEGVPVAEFSADSTVGIMPLNISFTDLSTGVPTNWTWSFGDGSNSTEQNPSHIYNKVGKYTVKLTAKNAVGSNSTTKTKYIDVEIVPIANFTANKTVGKLPMAVKFTDRSTGTPTSWYWDFGDGNTSTEKSPKNVYGAVGKYNVTLTATNAVGNNTYTRNSYIDVEVVPVANFTADPTVGANPLNVSFTDLSTGVPTNWTWTFGDGNNSTEQNPSHIYSKGGQYSVKLTAKNAVGSNSTTLTKYITVESVPSASFSASPTSGAYPLNVTFTDKSTGFPESWYWDFGDGSTSTEQKPVHTYSEAGKYTVNLTVTNLAGSGTKSMSNYIKVS